MNEYYCWRHARCVYAYTQYDTRTHVRRCESVRIPAIRLFSHGASTRFSQHILEDIYAFGPADNSELTVKRVIFVPLRRAYQRSLFFWHAQFFAGHSHPTRVTFPEI